MQTLIDVIVAPVAAFERLRTAPTWGLAFIIATVAYTIALYLMMPATIHAIQASWPAMVAQNPRLAAASPAEQQQGLAITVAVLHWAWLAGLIGTPVAILITSVIMLIFNAIGRGSASFAMLWAASANIAVPTVAIGGIVVAVIVLLRGADSFTTSTSIAAASPSLAWLVPTANVKLQAFLSALNVFEIWGGILLYLAMRTTAKVGAGPAIAVALILPLGTALFSAAGAK